MHTFPLTNIRRLGLLAIGVSATVALAACGGGTSGGPVGGGASGSSGTTDANGTFQFHAGDSVTFSLGVGSSNSLDFGSISPPVPAVGSARVFVLSLPNGLQVARVLQSLNHGTVNAMDVSGVTLSGADVTDLTTYIASGGTVLPSNVTDVQLQGQAQMDSGVSTSQFVDDGGATVNRTMSALQQTVASLQASCSLNVGTLRTGKVAFHHGFVTNAGSISEDFGIDYLDFNGTISAVTSNASDTIDQATYAVNTNVLTFGNSGATDTITRTMIAGKTLTVTGAWASSCGAVPLQIIAGSAGSTHGVQCQRGSQSEGSGTIGTVATIPGVITLTDSRGEIYLAGLLAGGSPSSGAVAVVEEPDTVASRDTAIDGILRAKGAVTLADRRMGCPSQGRSPGRVTPLQLTQSRRHRLSAPVIDHLLS